MKTFNDTKDDLDYQQQRLAILQAEHRADRSAAVEPARPAARRLDLAQQQPGHRPQQPRPAQPARAGRRPAQRLRHPARPVAAAGRAASARSTAPAATSCRPTSTNSISAASRVGQTATADVDGKTYRLKVTKIYPQVRNGQFQIDLLFVGAGAADRSSAARPCRRKLTLGDSSKARADPQRRLLQRHRRQLGVRGRHERQRRDQARRSSSAAATAISSRCSSGLEPGERVITSSYSGLVDKDRLTFSSGE